MFYYPTVLRRHHGCFSIIWLAATKAVKIKRRELLRVNVGQTCEDIVDYVTAQVPPPQPNLPKPRFSLYLSSQLQYGVVIVYHRQCGLLLEEIQQIIAYLLRTARSTRIDMIEPDRLILDLPENMLLMEEDEGAQDPFFGIMAEHQLPSPYRTHQPMVMDEVDPQRSLVPGLHATSVDEAFKSPLAVITLREEEQFVIHPAEFFEGAELPEATARELDMLLDQQEQFHIGVDVTRIKRPRGGKRRQLVFADPEIQISSEAIQEQIEDPLTETLSLAEVLLDLPMIKQITPAQLFNAPCCSLLHPDLLLLWKQSAHLATLPQPGDKRRWEEDEDEEEGQDREILRAERRKRSSVGGVSGSPQEEAQVPMEAIVEETIEMPEAQTAAETQDITASGLLSLISNLQRFGEVTFDSLLPPEANRTTAARTFNKLLELASARQVDLRQTEPYDTITIIPGPLSMTT
ncbi:REC8 meiotic recombination protein b [Diretmus argenteus]